MADFDADLVVIGGGSGGLRAARAAAEYGAKVILAERDRIGGTCILRGCVPKKLMVYAARYGEVFEQAAAYGWVAPPAAFDWDTMKRNRDKVVAQRSAQERSALEKAGVAIRHARAALEDPHTVRLDDSDERIRARMVLIATGAKATKPDTIPGIEHAVTSDDLFHLDTLPRCLAIIGGGYIAVEFAGIFAGLGSAVTLINREAQLLPGFDTEIAAHLAEAYAKHEIAIKSETEVRRIEKHGEILELMLSNGERLRVDQTLVATGRVPQSAGLGLEAAGVTLGDKGTIVVDAFSATAQPSIYAIGDVTDRSAHTPVAIREGQAVADTVVGGRPTAVDHGLIANAVFSDPEIGVIGLTEAKARERYGADIDVYKRRFQPMRAAMPGLDIQMTMKLVVARATGKVLGVHILGDNAAEIIQATAIAVTMGATKADFDRTFAIHPTDGEELVTMRNLT
jgi:glutathione reductase (NADPH)